MIAATFWSLLTPALEAATTQAWAAVVAGCAVASRAARRAGVLARRGRLRGHAGAPPPPPVRLCIPPVYAVMHSPPVPPTARGLPRPVAAPCTRVSSPPPLVPQGLAAGAAFVHGADAFMPGARRQFGYAYPQCRLRAVCQPLAVR